MNDIKESISVQQVHGNADKYIITNRAVEEVNGDKLIEIYKSIEQGLKRVREDLVALPEEIKKRTDYLTTQLEAANKQIADMPKISEKRKEDLLKDEAVLTDRLEKITPIVKRIMPVEPNPEFEAAKGG